MQESLQAIAPTPDPESLAREVAGLRPESIVMESGDYLVLLLRGDEAPRLLYEIGRLRELTFRSVGEGTGSPIDLDWFDSFYLHLVVWHRRRTEVVGAYRLGQTDVILPRYGIDGLYTSTLFDYKLELLTRVTPALELGRSFVRPEYHKTYAPLLLLWTGIARFVAEHPYYRMLFGAVSVSNEYSELSKRLIAGTLRDRHSLPSLARFVNGRSPAAERIGDGNAPSITDIDDLAAAVERLEGGSKSIPVLVQQYVRLGGKVLAFTRDPGFQNTLDGLMLVDLTRAPRRQLARFMGAAELAAFLEYHQPSVRWPSRIELPAA